MFRIQFDRLALIGRKGRKEVSYVVIREAIEAPQPEAGCHVIVVLGDRVVDGAIHH